MSDTETSQAPPIISIWFGNFFEPFYSDRDSVLCGLAEIARLGFNTINLDSKAWEDFFARYRGELASPYVAMQEFMIREAAALGMKHTHLALYLCGDNLYPTIRDVPPVRGEESVRPNGELMGTYKYWSPRAQQTMVDHVRGLLQLYRHGMRTIPGESERIVMQTMFEPIPKPSFDADGRQRYLAWLKKRYSNDVGAFNRRYALATAAFEDLKPTDYWLRPEELNWVDCARPTALDFAERTPDFHRWIDNQAYLAEELIEYLATMKRHWRQLDPAIFIEPVLHQWGYFFNPPGHSMWQTGQRALDVYRCTEHVDGTLFIAAPLNAENRPDAAALSVEASIMRCANPGREFTAGLYLGRHVNGDIYSAVPPAEAVATLVANGAQRLHAYGYSGLDDGGVLYRMDRMFKDSLRTGNEWAAKVIPLLDRARDREAAIVFPREMSLYEPLEVDPDGRHRMDLLGWYSQLTDLGWQVDILHPDQIAAGLLAEYKILVVPHNSLYDLGDNGSLEAAAREFVVNGGRVFHGPHSELARRAFDITEEPVDFDCIQWREQIIPHGWSTVAFSNGEAIATYLASGKTAIAETRIGSGRVCSLGFQYGYAYSRCTMPIVPPNYGRREMHPIVLLKQAPIEALIGSPVGLQLTPLRGVECGRFGNRMVIVNHRSSPLDLGSLRVGRTLPLDPCVSGSVASHSAAYVELDG